MKNLDNLPWMKKIIHRNNQFYERHRRDPNWREYQELHSFRETDYTVNEREWRMLDYANPNWFPALPYQDLKNI